MKQSILNPAQQDEEHDTANGAGGRDQRNLLEVPVDLDEAQADCRSGTGVGLKFGPVRDLGDRFPFGKVVRHSMYRLMVLTPMGQAPT